MNASQQHCILISSGSNIDKEANTIKGLDALHHAFGELTLSPVYESQSVGFKGDNFFNLVIMAYTTKSVKQVCAILKKIEDDCGRLRQSEKFSPRTLDLDLLTFDDLVCEQPVSLPRDEITHNAFVLQPMADIAPDHVHPSTGKTYAQMWQQFDKSKQRLWAVPFAWSNMPL
ncbi:2-amino-4-hydroxy-6-hydroxymethyldihydropteridine diphosphokinase [Glaciecola sp. XM2]|jgi:2-amino-4-hydroxy-6-hydroxymethyldihydropteridine diphosphokinase|uniref:2-amino-4-hydroxy-6- hydroxymethyldihydropteridine diphosphokinase n=1 Tax=Glaciecola sp. XM2 TaxID=1914931 RepID=UPI001BDDCF61|nr:2-amino-4-hydroxy-6-hydroxymethyldihydropteridine diphosphokinase [Glaciecola sp. XM2]MBT1450378.1 2-amino-4-hydroxy-6-hydroxymethyldihydropteridine diphosphokinase [Glaciecola sp. XM2]